MSRHELLGGKLQVYRRGGLVWHCSASVGGEQRRTSTKEESLALAKEFAEDWYMTLRGKDRAGVLLKREKSFKQVADQFVVEYEVITEGQRSPAWVRGHKDRIRLHLVPFFGDCGISEVTAGKVQEYRVRRAGQTGRLPPKSKEGVPERPAKPPARSTIHDEIVTLRQVLKTAIRHGWLAHLPDLSLPYRAQSKVVHRPWFSPTEYKSLYQATRAHKNAARGKSRWNAEQLHDYVLFMANTGLRPDEAANLQHRDVTIVKNVETGERILEIEVRGKRGIGFCKSMPGGVLPYERVRDRPKQRPFERLRKGEEAAPLELPKPVDHLFPGDQIKLFNRVLDAANLKYDRDGLPRTAYSLRHTYICLRLMEGADIYQIAKNCRTSVEMIEKHYAIHLRNTIDADAINVRRPKGSGYQPESTFDVEDDEA